MSKSKGVADIPKEWSEDPGIIAALAYAAKHDTDAEHARHVCALSNELFDRTVRLHGLGKREKRLLTAAAILHDIGWTTRPAAHHKGSRDLIMKSGLNEFAGDELKMIACIARYHRKAHPKQTHAVYADLDEPSRKVVNRLSAILRVADGLDRSHSASATGLRVEHKGDKVNLHVNQSQPNSTDAWAATHKRALFEEVFGVTLNIVCKSL